MAKIKFKFDKDELYNLFINQNLSSSQIGKIYNCNGETILRNLKHYGINKEVTKSSCIFCLKNNTKKSGGKTRKGFQKYYCNECGKYFNDNTLFEVSDREKYINHLKKLYIDDELSTTEIGKILNLTPSAIQVVLKKHNLSRSISEAKKGKSYFDINKLPYEKIIHLYTKELKSFKKIAKIF